MQIQETLVAPFTRYRGIVIPVFISNYIHHKVWVEIDFPHILLGLWNPTDGMFLSIETAPRHASGVEDWVFREEQVPIRISIMHLFPNVNDVLQFLEPNPTSDLCVTPVTPDETSTMTNAGL